MFCVRVVIFGVDDVAGHCRRAGQLRLNATLICIMVPNSLGSVDKQGPQHADDTLALGPFNVWIAPCVDCLHSCLT
jgi:hypothetical protein